MKIVLDKNINICVHENETAQVLRAANSLSEDFFKVLQNKISLTNNCVQGVCNIIIATKENALGLASQYKENLSLIENETESYVIDFFEDKIIILGSDMRGTIFGIYELSKMIGVSPFHYWADVPVKQKDKIILDCNRVVSLTPSIRYRGLFINDERNLQLWSKQFINENEQIVGSPNKYVYERVFDLLLRLKANTLWPSMHRYSTAFYTAKDENGVCINAKTASAYGIIIGTSHCEPMLRNNEGEWLNFARQYAKKHGIKSKISYDFTQNADIIKSYWSDRVKDSDGFESMYTIGMRGVHDEEFTTKNIQDDSLKGKIDLMGEIIDTQKEILKTNLTKNENPIKVFIPYKEVSKFYNGDEATQGLKIDDDVIIMYCNDNFGYLRQVPSKKELETHSRFGLYYHISYWGAPLSYLWLNTTPLSLMYNQLKKAYDNQIRDFWILNVGDLKLSEIGFRFFLEVANDIDKYNLDNLDEFIASFAKDNFNLSDDLAKQTAEIVTKYFNLGYCKKPEFYGLENQKLDKFSLESELYFSVLHFDEADNMLKDILELESKARTIFDELTQEYQAAFYETILYSIISMKNVIRKQVYFQKSVLAKKRFDKRSYYKYTVGSLQSQMQILKETKHFNKEIQNGKWNKLVAPYPIPHFSNRYPISKKLKIVPLINPILPYKLPPIKLQKTKLCTHIPLPLDFHSEGAKTKYIYLYSTNFKKLNFEISKSDFINVEYETDEINIYPKIKVSINWDLLNAGKHEGEIVIKDSKKNETKLIVNVSKENLNLSASVHYQTDNYFSIKATDFDRLTKSQDEKSSWSVSNGLGRKSSALTFSGEKQEDLTLSATAVYKLYFTQIGTYKGEIFRLPSLNEGNTDFVENTCKLAIGIDEQTKVLHGQAKSNSVLQKGTKEIKQWYRNVLENVERLEFEFEVKDVGLHELTVFGLDSDISFEKIVLYTGDKLSSYFGM